MLSDWRDNQDVADRDVTDLDVTDLDVTDQGSGVAVSHTQ